LKQAYFCCCFRGLFMWRIILYIQ